MKPLGFAIIGCGVISGWHARAIAAVEGAHLIGAADRDSARCETFCQQEGCRAFASIEELLACPEVDIVNICTPSGLHASLAIQAARAGKHVVVEKPMALTVKDADDMIAACRENGVALAVISQIRFSPALAAARTAIARGDFGRIVTGDVFMKFYRSAEYYASAGWRGTWAMDGGGALMNQGIHGIDGLLFLMGNVRKVTAYARTLVHTIEVEDTCSALLEFENGALGIVQGTTSVYPGYPRRIEVSGADGTVALEEDTIVRWDTRSGEIPADVSVKAHADISSAADPKSINIAGHIAEMRDIAAAIREGRTPFVDGEQGRRPVALINAIYASEREKREVDMEEF